MEDLDEFIDQWRDKFNYNVIETLVFLKIIEKWVKKVNENPIEWKGAADFGFVNFW